MSDRLIFNVVVTLLIAVCVFPGCIENRGGAPMFVRIGIPVFMLGSFWLAMYAARKH